MTRIVTGLFDSRRNVDLVIEHLVQEFDIPRERIQVHARDASNAEARSTQDSDLEAPAATLGLANEVMRGYSDGLRRGGILLAAQVDDDHVQRAVDAYGEYGATGAATHDAEQSDIEARAPQQFAGETGAAPLPEEGGSSDQ